MRAGDLDRPDGADYLHPGIAGPLCRHQRVDDPDLLWVGDVQPEFGVEQPR